ncbi:MAG TPA: condensation domain-containing protein, partial [Leptolyngbyaceae cyanobacterium]
MNLKQFVADLAFQGVKLSVENNELRVRAPKGVLTPANRELLAKHKAEILSLLQNSNGKESDNQRPLVKVERTANLPLSFAQEQMWFLSQLDPTNPSYNEPLPLRIHGAVNVAALEYSLNKIIQRHEVLRTNFVTVNEEPVQVIAENLTVSIPVVDLQHLPESEREITCQQLATQEVQRPFDLASSALIRATLFQLTPVESVLIFTMHHIIFDGWSWGIFLPELETFYTAFVKGSSRELPELPIQYADFALWQRQGWEKPEIKSQLSYWQKQLQGAPALLELPSDRVRPNTQTFRGAHHKFALSTELNAALSSFSQQQGVTPFMTLLAAFNTLLYRYTGQTDICVGTVTANRDRPDLASLIGFFVNMLVLRTNIAGEPSFADLLSRVKEVTLGAYAHQDVPFEKLVEELHPVRDLSYTPLVQVMLTLYNQQMMPQVKLDGSTVSYLAIESATAKFDLTLAFQYTPTGLEGVWEYNTDLFDASTIARMTEHLQIILAGAIAHPQEKISLLPILSPAQQQQLLIDWNNTSTDAINRVCTGIHQLFEAQVEKTPDAVALVFKDEQFTYNELNIKANKLAQYLQSLGVKPDVLVGLSVERSPLMVIALLAILKAGGAYVPLDPEYPQDRLRFILEDTQVRILLTQEQLIERLSPNQAKVVFLEQVWSEIAENNPDNPTSGVTASHLANVIYTSGSTGKPKGVMVEHRGLVNLAHAQIQAFAVDSDSRVLQFASFNFDACISEILMSLGSGATLYLGTKDSIMPGMPLLLRLREDDITHVTLPPSALSVLPDEELPALKSLIVAGEACPIELVKQWSVGRNFFNAYGPTESSVCATIAQCTPDDETVIIGRPVANVQVYILDAQLQPVPIGVPGELHIGGAG